MQNHKLGSCYNQNEYLEAQRIQRSQCIFNETCAEKQLDIFSRSPVEMFSRIINICSCPAELCSTIKDSSNNTKVSYAYC